MISIKSFLRRDAKASSKGRSQDNLAASSLFSRDPLDFDLISQLTHMSAAAQDASAASCLAMLASSPQSSPAS